VIYRVLFFVLYATSVFATTFEVGPEKRLQNIGDVPWESLAPGDSVLIHWRPESYQEKWVICRRGTAAQPIVVRGVVNAQGERPVIDGRNATTRSVLNYWNEARGVIKIGGANVPEDTMPAHIVVENLEIRSGRPPYTFMGRDGVTNYSKNSAAIFVEKGESITVRNCVLHDCGNGFFCASQSSDILVEACHIYDNGIEGSIYEHNNYTEANGIVFQFNHFGPLRDGCGGNNLKDRSAGTVIRYNWIEDGNRQLDLVDSDHEELIQNLAYRHTFVYGNVLIEGAGEGNRQMVHYGGDSGQTDRYRKGTLYFYNNTVVSSRTDRTTLFRLSSNDESCDMFNNIVYTTHPGESLSLSNSAGTLRLQNNWIMSGWVKSFESLTGEVVDLGTVTGSDPGFVNVQTQNFALKRDSPCVDGGRALPSLVQGVTQEYVAPQTGRVRQVMGALDLGAFEWRVEDTGVLPDLDGSGLIDFSDFVLFAAAFGSSEGDANFQANADLDGNRQIGFPDFLIFVFAFGKKVEQAYKILLLKTEVYIL
jgi:hypothetical protein